jgi:hypothetical protein
MARAKLREAGAPIQNRQKARHFRVFRNRNVRRASAKIHQGLKINHRWVNF